MTYDFVELRTEKLNVFVSSSASEWSWRASKKLRGNVEHFYPS